MNITGLTSMINRLIPAPKLRFGKGTDDKNQVTEATSIADNATLEVPSLKAKAEKPILLDTAQIFQQAKRMIDNLNYVKEFFKDFAAKQKALKEKAGVESPAENDTTGDERKIIVAAHTSLIQVSSVGGLTTVQEEATIGQVEAEFDTFIKQSPILSDSLLHPTPFEQKQSLFHTIKRTNEAKAELIQSSQAHDTTMATDHVRDMLNAINFETMETALNDFVARIDQFMVGVVLNNPKNLLQKNLGGIIGSTIPKSDDTPST